MGYVLVRMARLQQYAWVNAKNEYGSLKKIVGWVERTRVRLVEK